MGFFDSLSGSRYVFTGADRAQLARLERKVDLILAHLGIEYVETAPPCPLSAEVQELARNPAQKIAAIALHRRQTGVGLKEAKDAVEAFIDSGR
jgi:hypothetical protein